MITVLMPVPYDDIHFSINVFGNGILPQIEITEPKLKLPDGPVLVNFPPATLERYSTADIAFMNIGPLDCKVKSCFLYDYIISQQFF